MLKEFESSQIEKYSGKQPFFKSGDTLAVYVDARSGKQAKKQLFQGLCIAKKNRGWNSTFKVLKSSGSDFIERTFVLHSPQIEIKVLKKGIVRRAKLYYLKGAVGKRAKIKTKIHD